MSFREMLRNPLLSSIVLTSLFVVSFAVGPYHSPTALAVLFAGIATMLLWVNLTGILNLISAFVVEREQLNELISKIDEAGDSEALINISTRATEKMASPAVSLNAKAFYKQVHEYLGAHRYANLIGLGSYFETLDQYSSQLQARHRVVTLTGSLATLFTKKSPAVLATSASTPTVGAGAGAAARAAAIADEVAVDEEDETSEADSPPALRARLPVPATTPA